MSTDDLSTNEDADMAGCDGEKVVTMMDVLQEQEEFEEDANAVLGASDDKNCTYSKGYVKRQAIYACVTCCTDAKTDPSKRAGVCLACSLNCHENHELVELYTKRNFRCDCGNPKFNSNPCQFNPNKTELNEDNKYDQNFSGTYCICNRPYPDPDSSTEDEMIQCIICEDWLHASHLEATVPANDQYSEMICKGCMIVNEFLHDYGNLAVNVESEDVDIEISNGIDTNKTESTRYLETDKLTNGTIDSHSDISNETETKLDTDIEMAEEKSKDTSKLEIIPTNEENKEKLNYEETKVSIEDKKNNDTNNVEEDQISNESSECIKASEEDFTKVKSDSMDEPMETKETDNTPPEKKFPELEKADDKITSDETVTDTSENKTVNVDIAESEAKISENITDCHKKLDASNEDDIVNNPASKSSEPESDTTINEGTSKLQSTTKDLAIQNIENSTLTDEVLPTENTNKIENDQQVHNENTEVDTGDKMSAEDNSAASFDDATAEILKQIDETSKSLCESKETEESSETIQIQKEEVATALPSPDTIDKLPEEKVLENSERIKESIEKELVINPESNTETQQTNEENSIEQMDSKEIRSDNDKTDEAPEEASQIDDIKEEEINLDNIKETGDSPINKHVDSENKLVDIEMNNDIETTNENESPLDTSNTNGVETNDSTHKSEVSDNESKDLACLNNTSENKRKLTTEEPSDAILLKKAKLDETDKCVRPQRVKKVYKGATFWPSNFRQKLCTCCECLSMYKDLSVLFLIDPEDTVTAYETLGKEKFDGEPTTQYEKGLQALSSLDRTQQINALTEYNKMRDKLLDFLKSFKDRKEIVKEEDIRAFFAGMKPQREPDGVYFCR